MKILKSIQNLFIGKYLDQIKILEDRLNEVNDTKHKALHNIANISEGLAAAAEEQTASTEECSSVATIIHENTININQDLLISKESVSNVISTNVDVIEVLGNLNDMFSMTVTNWNEVLSQTTDVGTRLTSISKRMIDTTHKTNELDKSLDKSTKILSMIVLIADNIKLLALNAKIEAARVGEVGKGFEVVAGEMEKISHQTKNFVKEVMGNIEDNQSLSKNLRKQVVDTQDEIDECHGFVQCIESQSDLLKGVITDVNDTMTMLNSQLNNQSKQIDTIEANISSVSNKTTLLVDSCDEITQTLSQSVSSIEEVASSAESLSDMVSNLTENS